MSTYALGTVAVATVRGVQGVRVMRTAAQRETWVCADSAFGDGGYSCSGPESVTDVRPLVVLDLEHPSLTSRVLRQVGEYIRKQHKTSVEDDQVADYLADQIEAQTKPPRIDEPGLWGVVEARLEGEPFTFVRVEERDRDDWQCTEDGSFFSWDDLIDPTLIRAGVES